MVVMVMVMMTEERPKRGRHKMPVVVVMMVMVVVLSELHAAVGRFGAPRIVRLQGDLRVRNRIEKIPVSCRGPKLIRLRRYGSVGGGKGRKCGGRAEQAGYLFVHVSSEPVFPSDQITTAGRSGS
jgi:hypothetical protein